MIGVLMSATLPARLGEPSRALILARRVGRMRDNFPVVLGTLVSQTLLNILALVILGGVMFATVGVFRGGEDSLVIATIAPLVVLALLFAAPALLRRGKPSRFARVQQAVAVPAPARVKVRKGLQVFRRPKLGAWAATHAAVRLGGAVARLLPAARGARAWTTAPGSGAAAAVLFAVNVTAALPATPSNLGVFQAACVAVLSAYGVGKTDALAYGIILQAVEIATALAMGMPALVREGMTWKDLRLRALHAAPVQLGGAGPRPGEAVRSRPEALGHQPSHNYVKVALAFANPHGPRLPPNSQRRASSSSMAAWAPPWSSSSSRRRTTWASRASATRRSCSTAPT